MYPIIVWWMSDCLSVELFFLVDEYQLVLVSIIGYNDSH